MDRVDMLAELKEIIEHSSAYDANTDARLYRYMSEGQDRFCELTGFFRDKTNFSVTLVEDQVDYPIPSRAIQVLNVWYGVKRLEKYHSDTEDEPSYDWDFDPNTTGMPGAWRADRTSGYITFNRTPTADEAGRVLALHLWRYSQNALSVSNNPEFTQDFAQFACIEWAASKCVRHHDLDTYDSVLEKQHLSAFYDYVNTGKRAFRRLHGVDAYVGIDQAYKV